MRVMTGAKRNDNLFGGKMHCGAILMLKEKNAKRETGISRQQLSVWRSAAGREHGAPRVYIPRQHIKKV